MIGNLLAGEGLQRVKMTDEGLSKAEEWLTTARSVNFSGNIDKHVAVTTLLILFPLLIFLLNSLLYGEVINVGNLKKRAERPPLFIPCHDVKTQLTLLSVTHVNPARCAHHM